MNELHKNLVNSIFKDNQDTVYNDTFLLLVTELWDDRIRNDFDKNKNKLWGKTLDILRKKKRKVWLSFLSRLLSR